MTTENNAENYARVQNAFGINAHNYTISAGHADSNALAALVALAKPAPTDSLLDIGTGAGHTAIAFAPHVARVVAYDLTPQMLEETARNAAAKGVTNLQTQQGAAETLPFEATSFELVTCRLTTHHFADLPGAVLEMARVLKPGGKLIIADTTVPEDAELDDQINQIEILRDPSHVRNYRESEWHKLLLDAGLTVRYVEAGYYNEGDKMDFTGWVERIGTSAENVTILEDKFRNASPALQEVLQIELRGDAIAFALPRITLIAIKPEY